MAKTYSVNTVDGCQIASLRARWYGVLPIQLSTLPPPPTYSAWIQAESEWIPGGMVGMVGIW